MCGIYVHIPFCLSKCSYCNFFSLAIKSKMQECVDAIAKEIHLQKNFFDKNQIKTIYFGGGTPSMLNKPHLERIFNAVAKNFDISNVEEITLESNPEDICKENLLMWKSVGINRLSIGIQSTNDAALNYLGRNHSGEKAINSILSALEHGFHNMSIDLIYGIPTLDNNMLINDLVFMCDNKIPHISAYSLSVEDKTQLKWQIENNKKALPNEDTSTEQYFLIEDFLTGKGYNHYEISNYALDNFESKHNSAYWQYTPYLGIGPSAHSFNNNRRCWNTNNITEYIKSINENKIPSQCENLSLDDNFNEYIMTSLRTSKGIDLQLISNKFGSKYHDYLITQIEKQHKTECFSEIDNHLTLTKTQRIFADQIASDLFIVSL